MRSQFTCTLSELRNTPLEMLQMRLRASAAAEQTAEQLAAWDDTLAILQHVLASSEHDGRLYFEFAIPRLGARIDVVLIIQHVVFVLEFKTGSGNTTTSALDQVTDYALDLRYFHKTSHDAVIAPFLVTDVKGALAKITRDRHDPRMTSVAVVSPENLAQAIDTVLAMFDGTSVQADAWVQGAYERLLLQDPPVLRSKASTFRHWTSHTG